MRMPETLSALLQEGAGATPDAIAVTVAPEGVSLSYGELQQLSRRAAAGLRSLGLQRGDAVALWIPSGIEWVVLEFAAARLGLLVVALNPRYKPAEVRHLLTVSQARALVFVPGFHGIDYGAMVQEVLRDLDPPPLCEHLIIVGSGSFASPEDVARSVSNYDDLLELFAQDDEADVAPDEGEADDLVNVFGTSGTTSFPKLAGHHQAAVVRHAHELGPVLELGPDDVTLCFLPLCGAYGFIALTSILAAGGRAVILPVYSAEAVVESIAAQGITCVLATEAVIRSLFTQPGLTADTARSWTKGGIAGLSVTDLIRVAEEDLGVRLTNLYGSSELFAMMAAWRLSDPAATRSTPGGRLVGRGMRARAADPLSGEVLATGEPGELQFAGYNVTGGYVANGRANEAAFTDDGWYRTGDHGAVLEDGRAVRYDARLSDTLRLRGYLTSPTEIEELILAHGSVREVQVVGVPDAATGEDRAVAFVRCADPEPGLAETLREHCRACAAGWKVPAAVLVVAEFPMTPSANGEKVKKGRLREMAEEHFASSALSPGG